MSLPSVEWRYVGTNTVTGGTIDTVMDNIYELATSTGYIDGSVRTQGSGSAGTWSRYQTGGGITEAIYVVPPSGDQSIIIAGSSGSPSPSPTMTSPDTYVTNALMVNVIKNPGSFDSWNASDPFTSGVATGYNKFLGARNSASVGLTSIDANIYLYESKESIAVFLISSTTNSANSYSNGFFAGALWDAESTNSADVESDGRLYGLISSGHFASIAAWTTTAIWGIDQFNSPATIDDTATESFITKHGPSNGESHIVVLNPGASSIKYANMFLYPITPNSSSSLITPSGKYARVPILYRYKDTSHIVGRLREVSFCQRGLIGQRHVDGVNTIGHVVSCSDYSPTPADAILLEY